MLSIVGRGAASVVYHARHATALTSEVALKVLLNQPQKQGQPANSEKLRKEALAMVSSRHKHVIRLDDFHSIGDLCYLAMEYAPLGDLRKYISHSGGRLNPLQAEVFLTQAAEALDFIHRVGIIHRDIKPDNILVINEGEIRLGDFGVAVLPGEKASLNDLRTGVGTMNYMAPEVLEGTGYEKRSDIYSLGVTFYELLTGIHPFENAPLIKQLDARQDNKIAPINSLIPEIPYHVANVITQAMSFDPAKRFPTAKDLVQSLLVNKAQSGGGKPSAPEPSAKPNRARPPIAPRPAAPQPARNAPAQKRSEPAPDQRDRQAPPASDKIAPFPPRQGAKSAAAPAAAEAPRAKAPPAAAGPSAPPVVEPAREPEEFDPFSGSEDAVEVSDPADDVVESTANSGAAAEGESMAERLQRLRREPRPDAKPAREASAAPITEKKPLKRSVPQQDIEIGPRSSRIPGFVWALIMILGAVMIFKWYYAEPADQDSAVENPEESASPVPDAVDMALEFPALPPGTYSGELDGVLPGRAVPLTILSLAGTARLVVIAGIEGWTPRVVSLNENTSQSIRVASNGIILDLVGEVGDGEIRGTFRNLVTGEEGSWFVAAGRE